MGSRKTAILGLTALALAVGATPAAMAQNLHFGVFGGITNTDLPGSEYGQLLVDVTEFVAGGTATVASSSMDDNAFAWGVQVGYSWGSYVGVEVGYTDLGSYLYDAEIDSSVVGGFAAQVKHESAGPTLAILGMYPLNERVGLHARAGLLFSDTRLRFSIEGESESIKGSDEDVTLGVGASWKFSDSYALRMEFQRFFDVGNKDKTGEEDVDLLSATFLFR